MRRAKVANLDADTPLAAAAERLLHARIADVRAAEAVAARRFDPDAVHDLRVACRRLRAAMKLFGKKPLRALDAAVERLQDALGEVRDAQLQERWLRSHRAVKLAAGQDRKERRAEARLRQALAFWTRRSEPRLLLALPRVHAGGRLGGSRARRRLRTRVKRVEGALEDARSLDPRKTHALRIAAKKLRYEAELLGDAFDLADAVEALAAAQSALGDLHDADVRLSEVGRDRRLAPAARAERRRSAIKARAALRRLARLVADLEERV